MAAGPIPEPLRSKDVRTMVHSALVAILTAYAWYKLVSVLVFFLVGFYFPGFRVGRLGWFSLNNISWQGRRVWVEGVGVADKGSAKELVKAGRGERTQVQIGSIALRMGGRTEHRRRQWIVLRIARLRVKMPKAHLEPNRRHASDASEDDRHQHQPSRPSPLGRLAASVGSTFVWLLRSVLGVLKALLDPTPVPRVAASTWAVCRDVLLLPTLSRLNSAARRSGWLATLFSVELLDVEVDIDRVCRLRFSFVAGVDPLRGQRGRFCAWAAVRKLELHEVNADATSDKTLAAALPGALEVAASAPLDPAVGLSSLLDKRTRAILFAQRSVDIAVRSHDALPPAPHKHKHKHKHHSHSPALIRLRAVSDIVESIPPRQGSQPQPRRHSAEERASKLTMLRSVRVHLPTIQVAWKFEATSGQLAKHPTVPATTMVETQLRGLHASLEVRGQDATVVGTHADWHGKDRAALVSVSAGWTSVAAGLSINGVVVSDSSSAREPGARFFHLDKSALQITSSWLPRKLNDRLGRPPFPSSLPGDDGELVVVDAHLGALQGSLGMDDLDSLMAVASAVQGAPNTPPASPRAAAPEAQPATLRLAEPPPLVACLRFDGIGYQIRGPARPGPDPFGRGEASDGQREVRWQDPDSLCVELARVELGVQSSFADLVIRREDQQRRAERRRARRRATEIPESLVDVEVSPAHTKMLNDDRHLKDKDSADGAHPSKVGGRYAAFPLFNTGSKHQITHAVEDLFRTADKAFVGHITAALGIGGLRVFLRRTSEVDPAVRAAPEYELVELGQVDAGVDVKVAGDFDADRIDLPSLDCSKREGSASLGISGIFLDLSHPATVSALCSLIHAQASPKAHKRAPPPVTKQSRPRALLLPADIALHIAVSTLQVQAATSDPKFEPDMGRGVVVDVDLLVLEAFRESVARTGLYNYADRQSLKLQEDIRVQANTLGVQRPDDHAALGKASFTQMRVRPVTATAFKPARMQSPMPESTHPDSHAFQSWELKNRSHLVSPLTRKRTDAKPSSDDEPKLVDDLLLVPHLAVRSTLTSPREDGDGAGDRVLVTFEVSRPASMHVELRQIYSLLIVISLFRHLASFAPRPRTAKEHDEKQDDHTPRRPLRTEIKVNLHALHLHLVLAKVAPLFIEVDRLEVRPQGEKSILVEWDLVRIYGKSVPHRGKWDDILGAKRCSLRIISGPESKGAAPLALHVDGDVLRFRIPFKFVFAEIFDSIGTFVKACKQLAHQFVKGGMGSVLQPVAEPPKNLPEINLKFRILVIQVEDDPFETKLNAIWRAGCEELNDRQAREEAFLGKVAELELEEGDGLSDVESDASSGRSASSASFDAAAAVHEARHRLEAHNASAWKKRIRNATAQQTRQEEIIMRQLYGHIITNKIDGLPIDVVPLSKLTPLARLVITQVEMSVTKPSFPINELPDFLHDVGRGMPKDMEYTLLIPLHFEWRMLGATVRLRDFPLFLFHLPRPTEAPHQPVWEMKTDLVIAEELAGHESIRLADAEIVGKPYAREGRPYVIRAVRTTNPVKTYALPYVRVNAPGPVRFGWGNSMQPAIQDLVRCIDAITKPPADPSPRIGFWDKSRLILHWRVTIHFEGDSDVVVHLKGSRDPYQILGAGAGYAKVWRGDVRFLIGHDNPDQEVWQITSRDYVLGIPNLKEYVDSAAAGSVSAKDHSEEPQDDSSSSLPWSGHTNRSRLTEFLKVTAKLTNGVRWGLGLKLERTCRDGCAKCDNHGHSTFHRECRFWDFRPHYKVVLRGPEVVIQRDGNISDSYRGFRSDFVHFSISVTSPTGSGSGPSRSDSDDGRRSNSIHLSPESSTHFFLWWKTFDSALSLPVRQGKLFPSAQPPSKKFGKHVATLKYAFRIYPLFFTHTYREDSMDDWIAGRSSVIGVKARIDKFHADLHQRATELTVRNERLDEIKKVIRKVFYAAEIDCMKNEIRGVSATFTSSRKAAYAIDANLSSLADQDEVPQMEEPAPLSERDRQWLDLDDFNDLMFSLPCDDPVVKLLDTATCPRISYLRRPTSSPRDADDHVEGPSEQSKFGEEASHSCLIGSAKDGMAIQLELLDQRIEELETEERDMWKSDVDRKQQKAQELRDRLTAVKKLRARVHKHVDKYLSERGAKRPSGASDASETIDPQLHRDTEDQLEEEEERLKRVVRELYDTKGDFVNRLLVHSFSLLLSNSTRDILLKYHYAMRARKGFMYHLSPLLNKFITELAHGVSKALGEGEDHLATRRKSRNPHISHVNPGPDAAAIIKLLQDGNAGDTSIAKVEMETKKNPGLFDDSPQKLAEKDIPDEFTSEAAQLIVLMRPQIAFKSEADEQSTVIVTAFQAHLKSFNILDVSCIDDPVNARVLRRSFATISAVQAFYPTSGALTSNVEALQQRLWHYDLVPVEVLVDLHLEPWGFDRLLPRSSASVRYDKFNQLRIKKQGARSFEQASQEHLRTSTDWIHVDSDALSVTANAQHFRSIYNVVTDLLLYTDPHQKERNAAIETMLYSFGVENLDGIAREITSRQVSLRRDRRAIVEDQMMEEDFDDGLQGEATEREYRLWRHGDELGLLVQAIQRSQMAKTSSGKERGTSVSAQLEAFAKHISWFMHGEGNTPIAKFVVDTTKFEWRSYSDSSVQNRLMIQNMVAFNVSPNPDRTFDEILSKHDDPHEAYHTDKAIFKAIWKTLPPVGGIAIVDTFEMRLHPLRLQIDYEEGVQIFHYVFGATKPSPRRESESGGEDSDSGSEERDSAGRRSSESSKKRSPKREKKRRERREANQDDSASLASTRSVRSQESLVPSETSRNASGNLLSAGWRGNGDRTISLGSQRSRKASGPTSNGHGHHRGVSPSRGGHSTPGSEAGGSQRTNPVRSMTAQTLLTLTKKGNGQAEEMKRRAREYRTFLLINVEPTTFVLSYKGPKYVDVYGLTVKSPALHYQSRTWSYQDFFDHVKGEVFSSILKQTPHLISQFIATAHKNTAIPKMMGKKVAGGLGGLKLRVTKATAERMARAPTAQQQGQVVAETTGGGGGSGPGGHHHDGTESVDEARQRAASVSSASSKSPTSPLRFSIRGADGGSEEQAQKAAKDELVDVNVKTGGPTDSARAPPIMTASVLGGKAMVVEEPGPIGSEDGEADADEAADKLGDGPAQHPRRGMTSTTSEGASSGISSAHGSSSSSAGSAGGLFRRSSHHPHPRDPRQDSGTNEQKSGKEMDPEEAKAKAKMLLGRSYDHTSK